MFETRTHPPNPWCGQSGGYESVFESRTHSHVHLSTRILTPMHVKGTILHIQLCP